MTLLVTKYVTEMSGVEKASTTNSTNYFYLKFFFFKVATSRILKKLANFVFKFLVRILCLYSSVVPILVCFGFFSISLVFFLR